MSQGVNYRAIPKFTWGPAFANTLQLGRWLQEVKAYSQPADGSVLSQNRDGSVVGWNLGTDHLLEAKVVAIPREDELQDTGVTATGWAGDTGWEGFLEWAYNRWDIRFYPDHALSTYILVYVVLPWKDAPATGWFLRRDVSLKLRAVAQDTPFTGY